MKRSSSLFPLALLSAAISVWLGVPGTLAAADPSAQAKLTGQVTVHTGAIGGRQRRYILYTPGKLVPQPPLLFVFHGGGGDGPFVRDATGYEFDMLADANGFLVVYPDGIGRGWNSCRKGSDNDATRLHVDDVGFIEAIIAHEAVVHGIDKSRVFAAGHSFGGQMAYRFALERPSEFAGIAAISANLPAPGFNSCAPANAAVPVLIMNGTDDPVNPYRGGRTGRGTNESNTLSTEASAQYFVKLNGLGSMPEVARLPHRNDSDPTWVERVSWSEPGKASVILYTIHGGGHVVPQPYYRYPTITGRQTQDLDAPAVIWDFFSQLPPRQ